MRSDDLGETFCVALGRIDTTSAQVRLPASVSFTILPTGETGSMPGMTHDEMEAFLDEPRHLLRLGTNGTDGMPRVVPIWFIHRDGAVWFTPRARSAWLDDLRADRNVCVTIDETDSPLRKVIARGPAELVHDLGADDVWRDLYREIACRYTPERFADAYLTDTIEEQRALFRLSLDGAEVSTWRMPIVDRGEDPLAVWGRQYYHRS